MNRKIAVTLVVVGILLGTAVGVYLGIPHIAENFVSDVSVQFGAYFERDITWDEFRFHRHDRIELLGVKIRRRGAPASEPTMLSFARVDISYEPTSILTGKLRLKSVHLEGPNAHLIRFEDGSDNYTDFKEKLERLMQEGSAFGEGSNSPFRHLARVLPKCTIGDASLSLEDASASGGILSGIHFKNGRLVAVDESKVQEEIRLRFEGSFDVVELDTEMDFSGSFFYPEKRVDLTLRMDKRFQIPAGAFAGIQREVVVGGVEWTTDKDVVSFTDVALSAIQSDTTEDDAGPVLQIARVELELAGGEGKDTARALMAEDGEEQALIYRALKHVKRISLIEPRVFVARYADDTTNLSDLTAKLTKGVVTPSDEAPPPQATRPFSKKRLRKGSGMKVREELEGLFIGLEDRFRTITDGVYNLAASLPIDTIVIERGSIRYRDEILFPPGFQTELHDFGMKVGRGADPAVVEFDLGFEMAGANRKGSNRFHGRVHLDTRDVQVSLSVEALELEPYAMLFPSVFSIHPETLLRDTNVAFVYNHERSEALVEGSVTIDGLTFEHRMVASQPLTGMNVALEGNGRLQMRSLTNGRVETLHLDDLTFRLGDVRSQISGSIERYGDAPKININYHLPETPCQTIAEAIPVGLVPRLSGVDLRGTFAWNLDVSLDTADMESFHYVTEPTLKGYRAKSMGDFVNFNLVRGKFLQRVEEPGGHVREFVTGPGSENWVSYPEISPWMATVIGTTEDARFFKHNGFSEYNIKESIITNLEKGGYYRGASTVTQQLVKNLFLSREKTLSRKIQEFFITWEMEKKFEKEDLLALYFNVIEFGNDIYGIREASEHYFGLHPSELQLVDALFIVSMIPNPKKFAYQFRPEKGVTKNWQKRLEYFGKVMLRRGKITQEQFEKAKPFQPFFKGRLRPGETPALAIDGDILENSDELNDEDVLIPAHELDDWDFQQADDLGFVPEVAP